MPLRSKAIIAVSAFMPGTANSVVLGSRGAPSPKITASGVAAFRPASSRSRKRCHARRVRLMLQHQPPPRQSRQSPRRFRCRRAVPRSWPPPLISGSAIWMSPRRMSAPAPCGPPSLCAERLRRSAPSVVDSAIDAARRPAPRRHAARRWRAWTMSAISRDRLDDAGLVVGEHHRNKRTLGPSKARSKSMKIDNAVAGDRQFLDRVGGKAAAAAHRRMLDRRDKQPVAPALCGQPISSAGVSASMLASVAPLVKVTFLASAPTRAATCSRASSINSARRPALGMHRGGIAGQLQRGGHGRARLLPQRRGGIPVEIGPFSHGIRQYPSYRFGARPRKKLAFCPGDRVRSPPSRGNL